MNKKSSSKSRKQIKAKMATVLAEKIESLPCGYKEILLDDLVTAFENRLAIMLRADCIQIGVNQAQVVELRTT